MDRTNRPLSNRKFSLRLRDDRESYPRFKTLATRIRAQVVTMSHRARSSHVGGSLSIADLLAVLYGEVLNIDPSDTDNPDRDRFILSKGHGCSAVYAVLTELGFFPKEWLDSYLQDGSHLFGHITHHGVPGVEASTGSLGHGLAIGCGMALAGKHGGRDYRVFALLSDGECDEGAVWEAALFASHHQLDNLVAIVDYNKIQAFGGVEEILQLEPLAEKWRAFGWAAQEIDGHAFQQIEKALLSIRSNRGDRAASSLTQSRAKESASWRINSPGTTSTPMLKN